MNACTRPEAALSATSRAADLELDLERLMPARVPAGTGSAVFCLGSCFHPREAIVQLEIVVGGSRYAVTAFAMPRLDLAGADGRRGRGWRSGFWATFPFPAHSTEGPVELHVAGRMSSGTGFTKSLGRIEVTPSERPVSRLAAGGGDGSELIAICMAAFEPEPSLFAIQVESLRAQTDQNWVCMISDDSSSDERFAQLREIVGSDRRFVVSRSEARLGFYRNFERAMAMAPAEAGLVALCDQDDRWHPEKLQVLRSSLGDAELVYSDQRLTDDQGRVLRATFWRGRRNNYRNLTSQLVANTVTGAAMLMRRELAERALPFPEGPGFMFHDHWIGALAIASGRVAYVDRPLYDYVQHRGAVFGDVSSGPTSLPESLTARWRRSLKSGSGWFVRWRAAYFYGYLTREVLAQTLLVRCAGRLTPRDRRALERYIASARAPIAFAWLALRPLRLALGRDETLGSELDLVRGILWRRLVVLGVALRVPSRWLGDATLPDPALFQQRGLRRWRARR